jgi:hypothetical protein
VSGALVHYLYLSDGTKLAALRDGTGYIYCGSMVYEGTFTGSSSLAAFESTGFSAGRIVKNGSAIVPTYHVNDYLCSVRVVTDAAGEVLERNDYSGISPYAYCAGDPVNFVDPEGKVPLLFNFAGGFVSAGVEYGSQVIGNIVSNELVYLQNNTYLNN